MKKINKENSMYKFINFKLKDSKISRWYLYCDTTNIVVEHYNIYVKPQVSEGFNNILDNIMNDKKIDTPWGRALHIFMESNYDRDNQKGALEHATNLEKNVIENRFNAINEGRVLLLSDGVQYNLLDKEMIINEALEKDNIIFPQYNENDIRVIQWPNGTHWYAKIRNMDVVFEGEQKWDSEKEAIDKAHFFLKTLY